jgi:Ribbon-helix-helix protein, copG family
MMLRSRHRGAIVPAMRTTVTLAPDVAAAIEEIRRREGRGVSDVVNDLARRGLAAAHPEQKPFVQAVSSMGPPKIPLDDVSAALDILEGPFRR